MKKKTREAPAAVTGVGRGSAVQHPDEPAGPGDPVPPGVDVVGEGPQVLGCVGEVGIGEGGRPAVGGQHPGPHRGALAPVVVVADHDVGRVDAGKGGVDHPAEPQAKRDGAGVGGFDDVGDVRPVEAAPDPVENGAGCLQREATAFGFGHHEPAEFRGGVAFAVVDADLAQIAACRAIFDAEGAVSP